MSAVSLETIVKKASTLRMLLERFTDIFEKGEDQPADLGAECLILEELAGEVEKDLKGMVA